MELYLWNLRLASAYSEALHWVEVGLRNALSSQWQLLRDTRVPSGYWFDLKLRWFSPWYQPEAERLVRKAVARAGVRQQGAAPGKVVAELTFGFWTRMLSRHYEASLWTPAFRHAFPAGVSRQEVAERFTALHRLRNRVAHHEPLFDGAHLRHWLTVIQVLDWLEPQALSAVMPTLQFDSVIAECPPAIVRRLDGVLRV